MKDKILLIYTDLEDNSPKIESVWATKIGDNYRIDNIPFFAKNIAYGDIIKVENDDGSLYFERLLIPSGNSVIQMVIFDEQEVNIIGNELVNLGCDWEGSHIKNYIAIHIPKEVSYDIVKLYLEEGTKNKRWDFREACLGWK